MDYTKRVVGALKKSASYKRFQNLYPRAMETLGSNLKLLEEPLILNDKTFSQFLNTLEDRSLNKKMRGGNTALHIAVQAENPLLVKCLLDKSGSNTYALADINSEYEENKEVEIEIRQNKYLNNRIEGDHRFIKRIVRPMLGFKSFASARITIAGIETVNMIRKNQLNTVTNYQSKYGQFTSLMQA